MAIELLDLLQQPEALTDPDLMLVFASQDLCSQRSFSLLYEGMKRTPMIGCSTLGLMLDDRETASGISAVLLKSSQIKFKTFSIFNLENDPEGHADDLLESIRETCSDPAALLCFADGFGGGVERFASRLSRQLPRTTKLLGALAGGDPALGYTFQVDNERLMTNGASILVLDGPIKVASGHSHGLIGLGCPGRITEADGDVIKTIDDAPAIEIYRRHLGPDIEMLPQIGQTYPLGLGKPGTRLSIRSVCRVDWPTGALALSGQVREGSEVRVMFSQPETMQRQAAALAAELRTEYGDGPISLALAFSHHARNKIFSASGNTETENLFDYLAPVNNLVGFHALGAFNFEGILGQALSVLLL